MHGFTNFDLNADGRIVEQEFTQARDKRREQRVAEGWPLRNRNEALPFNEIDTDSDGTVAADEFSAYQATRVQEVKNRQ